MDINTGNCENGSLIEAQGLELKAGEKQILKNITFTICRGENWAITGPAGSGKTMLGKIVAGQIAASSGKLIFNLPPFFRRIMIDQQHNFRKYMHHNYYQRRFDSNYGNESPKVLTLLEKIREKRAGDKNDEENFRQDLKKITALLRISHLLDQNLIALSNGESKKIQLASALLQDPGLIVLDNPFIGLDQEARKTLHEIIGDLINTGIIVLLITPTDEIPENTNRIMLLDKGEIKGIYSYEDFLSLQKAELSGPPNQGSYVALQHDDLLAEEEASFQVAVEMRGVNVQYGDKHVLQDINWKVLKGECWALLGPNGSGKSTLLSLINGDNPKAFGNDILLFDRKKGSGESIWEIKQRIGHISPELHIYFQRDLSFTEALTLAAPGEKLTSYTPSGITVFEAIASGFNDQIGSSRSISAVQKKQVMLWMETLEISSLKSQFLSEVSLGDQRLILLCRALVKNPSLLILDEPCQGLDRQQTGRFINILDEVCTRFSKTLIYVSHYPQDIPSCVTRFLFLKKGRVKEIRSRAE